MAATVRSQKLCGYLSFAVVQLVFANRGYTVCSIRFARRMS